MGNTGITGRTKAPFRQDFVGSFLRPAALKQAREAYRRGDIEADQLKAVEDEEIRKLVEKQKGVGLQAVTDGEFRRSWWHLDFMWGFGGVEKAEVDKGYPFHGKDTRKETARLQGKIVFQGHPFLEHYAFLKSLAGEEVSARQTIPAPAQMLTELQRDGNQDCIGQFYSDPADLYGDIAAAYRGFILALYDLGCRNVQLDDCTWGMLCDEGFRKHNLEAGVDLEEMAGVFAALNNAAIQDLPDDLVITTHVCRGNYCSTWASSGGYDPVAQDLFENEKVGSYYLEFDTDRSGDFTPLRFIGEDKMVVLGLVSSKIGELEDKDTLIQRIEEASRYVPLDRLCLSPQCGFASTEEGNLLTEEQQWEKLRFIKEVAEEVWKGQ